MYQEVRDFKKWLVFNARGNDKSWTTQLTQVLKSRKSQSPFSISEGDWGAGWYCRITEEGNEECLLLSEDDIHRMITYLEDHYLRSGADNSSNRNADTKASQKAEPSAPPATDIGSGDEIKSPSVHSFYAILGKLSSANIGQHALIYGFLTFLLLQPVIITTNFKLAELDDALQGLMFIPIPVVSYLSVVSYSRTYRDLRQFWDVFKLCLLHNVVLALMITAELTIIDFINRGDTSLVSTIAILLLFMPAAVILAVPISLVTYFVRQIATREK